jgi:hypothetical protein
MQIIIICNVFTASLQIRPATPIPLQQLRTPGPLSLCARGKTKQDVLSSTSSAVYGHQKAYVAEA